MKKEETRIVSFVDFTENENIDNFTARYYDNYDDEKEPNFEQNSRFELFEDFNPE